MNKSSHLESLFCPEFLLLMAVNESELLQECAVTFVALVRKFCGLHC